VRDAADLSNQVHRHKTNAAKPRHCIWVLFPFIRGVRQKTLASQLTVLRGSKTASQPSLR
jgi:hypothetical protein